MPDVSMLFVDRLAQAIAEGRKTVTRRPVTASNSLVYIGDERTKPLAKLYIKAAQVGGSRVTDGCVVIPGTTLGVCNFPTVTIRPRHSAGDSLFVRECFNPHYFGPRLPGYRATWDKHSAGGLVPEPKWTPSIHMPRWAARSVRRILSVTPERLGPLSEAEARAEGFESPEEFAAAWTGIYGSRVRWVWRYEFGGGNA